MSRVRNTRAMLASPRCGARTRNGHPCRAPAAHGRRRCRMHGGAVGSGAPAGNRNAQTHGLTTADAIAERQTIRSLLDDAYGVLEKLGGARLPPRADPGVSDDDGTP